MRDHMSVSVPRRRGWGFAWTLLLITVKAYLKRDPSITFDVFYD